MSRWLHACWCPFPRQQPADQIVSNLQNRSIEHLQADDSQSECMVVSACQASSGSRWLHACWCPCPLLQPADHGAFSQIFATKVIQSFKQLQLDTSASECSMLYAHQVSPVSRWLHACWYPFPLRQPAHHTPFSQICCTNILSDCKCSTAGQHSVEGGCMLVRVHPLSSSLQTISCSRELAQ